MITLILLIAFLLAVVRSIVPDTAKRLWVFDIGWLAISLFILAFLVGRVIK